HAPIAGCRRSTTSTDCDDQYPCTTDTCTAGACGYTHLTDCLPPPTEICGDCIDNDGNGLTDFEDPACCSGAAERFTMELKGGFMRPRGATTKLRLRSILARGGMSDIDPLRQDVFLQIRPEGSTDIFCARIPADKFMHAHRAFMFWDHTGNVASAKGISDMKIKVRRNGTIRFRTHGKQAQMSGAHSGRVEITVGFHAAGADASNRCSATTSTFLFG